MENNQSDLTNPVFAEKAQADNSSEHSSLIEEMKNGIDLQPLEDMEKSEMIAFEDMSAVEKDDSGEQVPDKKQTLKKRVLGVLLTLVALCVAAYGGYNAYQRLVNNTNPAAAVYQKGASYYICFENNKKVELSDVVSAKISADGTVMVYSQDTSSKTGKYDIRLIDLTKRKSISKGGSLIVSGTEDEWSAGNDCAYIYYSEIKGSDTQYYAYSVSAKEAYTIAFNADQVFFPPVGDIVYFVKESGSQQDLYRIRLGEKAEHIETVSAAKSYSDDKKLEVFYTVSAGDQTYDLYKISGADSAEIVCKGVSEVYLDDYSIGGNLYYCVKSPAALNWSDFVQDAYVDSDAVMQKPDKGDFLDTKGFFIKRTVVNEKAYNAAMREYSEKLVRDEIREELNKLELGVAVASEYKIRVYDGKTNKELASGVKLENIAGFAKTGTPAIVYEKTSIDVSEKIDMDELYTRAKTSSVQDAIDDVLNMIRGKCDITNGYKYSWYNGTKVFEHDFDPVFDVSKAEFIFVGREGFFASVRNADEKTGEMYYCAVSGGVAKGKKIAEKVVSYEKNGAKLYVKVSQGENDEALYIMTSDGTNKKITGNYVQFFADSKSSDIILLLSDGGQEALQSVSLAVYDGKKITALDENIDYKHFYFKGGKIAYINNYQSTAASETAVQGGGELKLYKSGTIKEIDTGVTALIDF